MACPKTHRAAVNGVVDVSVIYPVEPATAQHMQKVAERALVHAHGQQIMR